MELHVIKLVLLLLVSIVIGCSSSNSANPASVLIFSTDYGLGVINGATNGPDRHAADTDDAYAVTLALQANLDIQGIITTFGNNKAQSSFESARRGLAILGFDKDILRIGAEGFLDALPVRFEPAGGEPAVFCVNDGVRLMRDVLDTRASGMVTLIALGPFTDIACLQRAFPDSFNKLREIIGLVGSRDGKPVLQGIDVVDFNFAMDPTALGLVLQQTEVAFTAIMFEVSQFGILPTGVIDYWAAGGASLEQQFYGQASQAHAQYWSAIFSQTDGQALFDAHTIFYLLNPQLYMCTDNMHGAAVVGGYPDTSAATTKNFFTVTPEPVQRPQDATVYTGTVRGCTSFVDLDSVTLLEESVQASVKRYQDADS